MQPVAGTRIWYQSFTDPDADRPYFSRLEAYLGSVASQGCQVEVFGIRPGARYPGPITDFRCAAQVIANALTAEQQGYDAFVIGNFGEAGLAEARSAARSGRWADTMPETSSNITTRADLPPVVSAVSMSTPSCAGQRMPISQARVPPIVIAWLSSGAAGHGN